MLTFAVPKKRKNAHISIALLALGLMFFHLSSIIKIYPYILQVTGLAFLILAIQIMQRYVLSDFVYVIDDYDNGDSVLNIIKVQGNKKITVCSVSLVKCLYSDDYEKIALKPDNSFDYRQNVLSHNKFALIYHENDDIILIKLEADDEFIGAISSRINKN